MLKHINQRYYAAGAAFTAGVISASAPAKAGAFQGIFQDITATLNDFPQMVNVFCYIFGVVFVVLGIFKMKAHVESPQQNELKDAAIRLIVGGALFATPTVISAASNILATNQTIGQGAMGTVQLQ